jgi:hypothetical protein
MRFNEHLIACGITRTFSIYFFYKAISKLVHLNLLISTDTRGVYVVNPKYVYRGTLEARKKVLRWLLKKINDPQWQKSNVFSVLGKLSGYRPYFGKTKI